ncbi:hypothetical protein FRC01_004500, partial [Tulasnella sp. 417]
AVLNDQGNTGLPSDEIEAAIRSNYPDREWSKSTLSHNLSYSDDFVRARGNWYLTGKTRGVEKCDRKKQRKAAEARRKAAKRKAVETAARKSDLNGNEGDLGTATEAMSTLELRSPIKLEPKDASI